MYLQFAFSHRGDWYVLSCCRLFLTCFEEIALAQVDVGLFTESFQLGEGKFSNTNMQMKLKEAPKTKWTASLVQEKVQNRSVKFVSLRLSH